MDDSFVKDCVGVDVEGDGVGAFDIMVVGEGVKGTKEWRRVGVSDVDPNVDVVGRFDSVFDGVNVGGDEVGIKAEGADVDGRDDGAIEGSAVGGGDGGSVSGWFKGNVVGSSVADLLGATVGGGETDAPAHTLPELPNDLSSSSTSCKVKLVSS